MKKILTLLLLVVSTCSLRAAVHVVQVADFSFTPSNVNAICGDTILWIWVSGTHTTTSVSLPSCANGWNGQLNSLSLSYAYLVSCPGTYFYDCSIHSAMLGTINVSCATGLEETSLIKPGVFPNPFNAVLRVQPANNDLLKICDALGREIASVTLDQGKQQNLSLNLPAGIYMACFYSEGIRTATLRLVRQ